MPEALLSREQELDLHRRLVEADPLAPSILAQTYLKLLIAAVGRNHRQIPVEFIEEAVHLAIANVSKKPATFQPSRSKAEHPLFAFLQMSAQGDLRNRWKSENRHRRGRVSLDRVEQSSDAGKYLGRIDDPSVHLENQEEAAEADRNILAQVREGLSDDEVCCLVLMIDKERKTSAYARALHIEHLPKDGQKAEVKRVKDKLKKRIERRDHG